MRRRLRSAALALLGLLALTFVFFRWTPLALPGVEVMPEACRFEPTTAAPARGAWSGTRYELLIEQTQNCADVLDSAAVQRLGGHLFVRARYRAPGDGVATGCNCLHRSRLLIPDLPPQPQDFRIHVYGWL
ncbi:hypothetical protein [Roseateles violae]|uniref:Uncharacterized protein n=1 Tax=Roseateles violae TaxID=3058042 RepID=A0ABT8DZ49_9BURK|nr:hypothetical protein [Pelomonas sp. PFR6]MDN3922867.1 hypothetical protein [Pelomonas sp. PFR6]